MSVGYGLDKLRFCLIVVVVFVYSQYKSIDGLYGVHTCIPL